MDAPLALYRRYRPDTFEDVIGQEHVTQPLSNALDNNRVHHAYLFSGPHGCGKTTSARIMARALNCEKGPTSTPCGSCESCQELATGGPGSIDVIEIDAASHGGVDDTRELREKAMFGPMKARYKVYIIDEAHMVTTQGFNALLKLVEEPPSHLRFIFATTEPDKVIGTIKSRTHHYPFRLVPPKVLGDYMIELCRREDVSIEPTVVPLVVRAGAGSVRDGLSVLDQLIGGAGPDGVTYALATALLGYTPDSLLDETVDALAADDGATVFGVVDKVIESGQDPRRFAEDLLHRLRDLVVVSAVPDAAQRGLLDIAADQADRLAGQTARFGRAELTRAADIVSEGLTEMRGATAPRLLLEMMCARILLPGIDQSAEGLGARIDRIERRLSMAGDTAGTPTDQRSAHAPAPEQTAPAAGAGEPTAAEPSTVSTEEESRSGVAPSAGRLPRQPAPPSQGSNNAGAEPPTQPPETAAGVRDEIDGGAGGGGAAVPGQLGLVDVRRLWPGVLERVKAKKMWFWMLISQNAQVKDLHGEILTLAFSGPGPCKNFQSGDAGRVLHEALAEELGVDWRIEAIIDGSMSATGATGQPATAASSAGTPTAKASTSGATSPPGPSPAGRAGGDSAVEPPDADTMPAGDEPAKPATGPAGPGDSGQHAPAQPRTGDESPGQSTGQPTTKPSRRRRGKSAGASERRAAADASSTRSTSSAASQTAGGFGDDAVPHDDDDVVEDAALSSQELLARELGAELIDESPAT